MGKKRNRYRSQGVRRPGLLRNCLKAMLGVILVLSAVVLMSAALAHSYYALLEAPWLRIEEVQISGLKHLERKEILNTLSVPRRASFLTIKMSQLATRLESLAWVRAAVVRLDPPSRIVVEVTEREPLVIVQAEDCLLMDREGMLFARAVAGDYPGLPLVAGFSGMNLQVGEYLPLEPRDALREFCAALEKSRNWLPPQFFSECRWQGEAGFLLRTTQGDISIHLGSEDMDQKLERLKTVLGMLGERQWLDLVTRIDLDYANRAFVEGRFPSSRDS